jgi:hypothetical protein
MFTLGGRDASAVVVASSIANSRSGFCEHPVPIACGDDGDVDADDDVDATVASRSILVDAHICELLDTFGAMIDLNVGPFSFIVEVVDTMNGFGANAKTLVVNALESARTRI